jgi:hypothetical protein
MSILDYKQCDVCGNKTFYDAPLKYEGELPYGVGDWKVICRECAKEYQVVIRGKHENL